ncbi:MAG: type I methionyl aminopeptidase [Deltaproteobacteria bacterium]|nr:type I methionyl aminopeptidase [Deltaproteobacteria bacterium]
MIILKSPWEMEKMRASNAIVAEVLAELRLMVKPGVTTMELEEATNRFCSKKKVRPAFKGYRGYPYALCASVNEQVVHGFPTLRELVQGDIVSIDFGVLHDGYYGDAAVTIPVGKITQEAELLIRTTEESLNIALKKATPQYRLSDLSHAIQSYVESKKFSVVRQFVGHGIGKSLHEEPQIPNFGRPGRGVRLRPGMVLAIEPMVNAGGYEVEILGDGWTAVTKDRRLSAHFEHTVAVTENGCRILSLAA